MGDQLAATEKGSEHLLTTRTHTYTDLHTALCNEENACKSFGVNDEVLNNDVF